MVGVLAAVAVLVLIAVGALAATQPGFFDDPVGTITALFAGGPAEEAAPEAPLPDDVVAEEPVDEAAGLDAVGEPAASQSAPAAVQPTPKQAPAPQPEVAASRPSSTASTAPESTPPAQTAETPPTSQPEAASPVSPPAAKPQTPAPETVAKAAAPTPKTSARPRTPTAAGPTSVYFRTTPLGARIVIDGSTDWTCTSPCTIQNLPAGSRTVVASLPGYQTLRRTFVAGDRSQKIVELSLTDARIEVILASEPTGAEIFIDGKKIPEKTNAKIKLAEGTYQVRVAKAGVGEAEQVVRVDRERLPFAKFVLAGQ